MLVGLKNGKLGIVKPARGKGKNGPTTIWFEEVKPSVCDHWYPTEEVIRHLWIIFMAVAECKTCAKAGTEVCQWCERH